MLWNRFLIVLTALFCMQPIQANNAGDSQKAGQSKTRYLDRATCFIKRQYTNKENRHRWFAAGALCFASVISIRFELLKKLLKHEEGPLEKRLGQADENKESEEEEKSDSEEAEGSEERAAQEAQQAFDAAALLAEKMRKKYAIRRLKDEPQIREKEEGGSGLIGGWNFVRPATSNGTEVEEEEEETAYESVVIHPCEDEEDKEPSPFRTPGPRRPGVTAPFNRTGEIPSSLSESVIERLIRKNRVIEKLKKYKHETSREEAEARMKQELVTKFSPALADQIITQAIQQIKQKQRLRTAINGGDWKNVIALLPPGVTPQKRSTLKRIFDKIGSQGTLSEAELKDLELIFWTFICRDGASITEQEFRKINERTHRDRGTLWEIIQALSSPHAPT